MTDRELLELAAKAFEINNPVFKDMRGWGEIRYGLSEAIHDEDRKEYWNPLTDDGDALRLAVQRGIKFRWHSVLNQALAWSPGDLAEIQENGEAHGGDAMAATRRAIVRAAAEIGRVME